MSFVAPKFKIYKKVLKNRLTVLMKPNHHIPRVEAHLWFNVGSKDEGPYERGMAHFIEHMLFKGTKKLSESDLNITCQKLTADFNAFTSQDYTCYVFRLPSHVWQVGLDLLAECMQNAEFNPQALASEVKAIIEEFRLYNENYQGVLFESMIKSLFPQHPYQNPIIGTKADLCALQRDNLYAFYKKHYHPANASLVIVGDVTKDAAFEGAARYFENIPSPVDYQKRTFFIHDELLTKTTTLFRPVSNVWYCYIYKVPGLQECQNHLLDLAGLILARGRSSRLYQRLVNKEQVAVDIDCSVYDFFEKGIFRIGVYPANHVDRNGEAQVVEAMIDEEIGKLAKKSVQKWEFEAAKKRTQVDFVSFLESLEKQAFVIGNSYLATGDHKFIERYLADVEKTTPCQLREFFNEFLYNSQQHKGYLLPLSKQQIPRLEKLQTAADLFEKKVLSSHKRTSPVELARWSNSISLPPPPKFSFPKPKIFSLDNGLEVVFHHNPLVPQVVGILNFKGNYLYEDSECSGGVGFVLRSMLDSTKGYGACEFAKLLEKEGVYLGASSDSIVFRCLSVDLPKTFKILSNVVQNPVFKKQSIEKIRQQVVSEINEFWDSPIDFVDQIAKEVVYQDHPYHKNPLGRRESIEKFDRRVLRRLYECFMSPQESVLVLVGDLSQVDLSKLVKRHLGSWKGPKIPDLKFPSIPQLVPQIVKIPLNREQTVLGFVAPSLSRKDRDYNALAILDIIVAGGSSGVSASRLFQLREQHGLFYAVGGSLIYGAREEPGVLFIKTSVAPDKVEVTKKLVLETVDCVGKNGITKEEFEQAKNLHFAASVELFESNAQMAYTFLLLKKLNLSFNLFDKQGEILSILDIDEVNQVARRFCDKDLMTVIEIGKLEKERKKKKGKNK